MKSVAMISLVCISILLWACALTAGWVHDGIPASGVFGTYTNPRIASDGSSGAIIVYQGCRTGSSDLYAQRISSGGAILWALNGVPVCTADGDQDSPQISSDGNGGAIIVWRDNRAGTLKVYAQRVSADGTMLWSSNGIALCSASGDQYGPTIISDGSGGAIITWRDNRSSFGAIYAQKVSAAGAIQWPIGGIAVCTAPQYLGPDPTSDRLVLMIVADITGGAIIAWIDGRVTSDHYNIYAQRISTNGIVQWTVDGVGLCTQVNAQLYPDIAPDGSGGAIVAWMDERGLSISQYDIYAQRVSVSGVIQWTSNGIPICTAAYGQGAPNIVSDGSGGAIVAWSDGRSGTESDIYAQRVSAGGVRQWAAQGIVVCNAPNNQGRPWIISDGFGGAILAWRSGNDQELYAQMVSSTGSMQWAQNGVAICTDQGSLTYPVITTDGLAGAVVAWVDGRNGKANIEAQRISAVGETLWALNGTAITMGRGEWNSSIIPDGSGGAIVSSEATVNGKHNIFSQRISARGDFPWGHMSVAVCSSESLNPCLINDTGGGAIIAWTDYRSGNGVIYAQRINASGVVQWTTDGVALCAASGNQYRPEIVSDGAGGAIVAWFDGRSGSENYDIYAQRVSASGAVQWTADGIALCMTTGDQEHPQIISDGAGGAIVTWYDNRSGNFDIYTQRVNGAGAVQWATNGEAICTAPGDQYPTIISDGAGGAIITWSDNRNGNYDIYAQRVNASGAVQWTTDGVALCTVAGDQNVWGIAPDSASGAIITWLDNRGGNNVVYAQRVNAGGNVLWAADGVPISAIAGLSSFPRIVSDGTGGAIITWADIRNGNDVYAQRVSATGSMLWTLDGIAVCTASGDQFPSGIISDGAEGAIIIWSDIRCSPERHFYAQRIRASGDIVATLLQHYSSAVTGDNVRIDWNLSEADENVRFFVFKASNPDWRFCHGSVKTGHPGSN